MAKIKISGIDYDQSNYTVLVTLVDTFSNGEDSGEKPLGEASVRFPSDTEMDDVKTKIVDAAQRIWKAHQNAQDKRHDIEELEFPPIS